jgi:hypothetical protein
MSTDNEPELIKGPLNVIDVRWALDHLTYGNIEEAKTLLKRALANEDRPLNPPKERK